MDDTLKVVTLGFFALLTFHASLERRARNDASRQVSHSFQGTGTVHSNVAPRGMFGMLSNDIWAVDIYGDHQIADNLPFYLYPRNGWKGHIRHLRLHFTHFSLSGLPVERFEADFPFVSYDIGHALYHDRLLLRGASAGPAEVRVNAAGLETFILTKYDKTIKEVHVTIHSGKLLILGKMNLLGSITPFTATGAMVPREGRYLDLMEPELTLNGKPATREFTDALLKLINPVLDADRDLKLNGFFTISTVELLDDSISIRGQATIPPAPRMPKP